MKICIVNTKNTLNLKAKFKLLNVQIYFVNFSINNDKYMDKFLEMNKKTVFSLFPPNFFLKVSIRAMKKNYE